LPPTSASGSGQHIIENGKGARKEEKRERKSDRKHARNRQRQENGRKERK
jgi:hypothetical protein